MRLLTRRSACAARYARRSNSGPRACSFCLSHTRTPSHSHPLTLASVVALPAVFVLACYPCVVFICRSLNLALVPALGEAPSVCGSARWFSACSMRVTCPRNLAAAQPMAGCDHHSPRPSERVGSTMCRTSFVRKHVGMRCSLSLASARARVRRRSACSG
eukprot:6182197-Pleurochrysis_carterae.AAC.1